MPADNVNGSITLSTRLHVDTKFKVGEPIELRLTNNSDEIVAIPWDFGLKFFVYSNDEWVELQNLMEYYYGYKAEDNVYKSRKALPTDWYYLPPKGVEHDGVVSDGFTVVSGKPNLPSSDLPLTLRILVTAKIYREGELTDELVAAYKDVRIVP
jgi:hypothetical protein